MEPTAMWENVSKLGLGIVLAISAAYLLGWMVKFILMRMASGLDQTAQNLKEMGQANNESHQQIIEHLMNVCECQKKTQDEIIASIRQHREGVQKEHNEMMICLGRINGYKHD